MTSHEYKPLFKDTLAKCAARALPCHQVQSAFGGRQTRTSAVAGPVCFLMPVIGCITQPSRMKPGGRRTFQKMQRLTSRPNENRSLRLLLCLLLALAKGYSAAR
jgi:hypothetical protein